MIPRRFIPALVLAALVVWVSFTIRVLDLSAQSLWYDEGFSVLFAQRNDALSLVARAAQLDLNTPLYYIALKAWMQALGQSEFAVRLLSAFAGVLSIALAYRLGVMALGRPVYDALAHGAPVLLAVAPVGVLAAQEARMYALAACLCLAAAVALLSALRKDRTMHWAAWAVLGVLAFATHVLCALVIGVQIAVGWLARRVGRRPIGRAQGIASLVVLAIVATWAVIVWPNRATYGVSYAASADWPTLMLHTLAAQALPRLLPEAWIAPAGLAVLAVLVLALVPLIVPLPSVHRCSGLAWVPAGIAAGSLVAIATFCALSGKFSPRYPTIVTPVLIAAIGVGVAGGMMWGGYVRALAMAGLGGAVIAGCAGVIALLSDPLYANEDFRGAVAHIRANLQPDERVVLVSGHFAPVFEYYWTGRADDWLALPADPVLNVNNTLEYASAVPPSNAALAGTAGAWLLLWQDDLVDPTGLVTALLRRQAQSFAPLPDPPSFTGLRVQHYRFFRPYQPLPDAVPVTQSRIEINRPQRGLTSQGCWLPHTPRAGDGWMEAQCFWRSRPFTPLSVYTKVSLRLIGTDGHQVAQSDQPITERGFPYVPFEKVMTGIYFMPLPPDLQPGRYTLRVIPYTDTEEISPQVDTPLDVLPQASP